jgi:hypothetical protein
MVVKNKHTEEKHRRPGLRTHLAGTAMRNKLGSTDKFARARKQGRRAQTTLQGLGVEPATPGHRHFLSRATKEHAFGPGAHRRSSRALWRRALWRRGALAARGHRQQQHARWDHRACCIASSSSSSSGGGRGGLVRARVTHLEARKDLGHLISNADVWRALSAAGVESRAPRQWQTWLICWVTRTKVVRFDSSLSFDAPTYVHADRTPPRIS